MDHHFKQSLRLQALKLKLCRCYLDSSVRLTASSGAGNKWLFKTSSSPFHLLPVASSSRRDRSGHTWVFPVLPHASHCLPVPALSTLPPADWSSHGPHFSFWSPASQPPMPLVGNHIPPAPPWSCLLSPAQWEIGLLIRPHPPHWPLRPHLCPLGTPHQKSASQPFSLSNWSCPSGSAQIQPLPWKCSQMFLPTRNYISEFLRSTFSPDIICSFKLALLSLVVIHVIDTPV